MCFGSSAPSYPKPEVTPPAPTDTPAPAGTASRQSFVQVRPTGTVIDTNVARGTRVFGETV